MSMLKIAMAAWLASQSEVDLLKRIDAARDAVVGGWIQTEGALVSPAMLMALLQVPYAPPAEYDLTIGCVRTGAAESLNIGLVAGGRSCMVVLDGYGGATSGVHRVAGRDANANPTTVTGAVFTSDTPATVVCKVRSNRLTVTVGDRTVIDWPTNYQMLWPDDAWATPNPEALYLGSYNTSYRITSLKLTPVTGEGREVKAATERPLRTGRLGGLGGGTFEDVAPAGGVLIGFRVTPGKYGPWEIVKSFQPVYRVGETETLGRIHGSPSDQVIDLRAKPGYAVGAIIAKTGARIDGFRVVFMKIAGAELDPKDSYESDWLGGRGGSAEARLGGQGRKIAGIYGREGDDLEALGLAYGAGVLTEAATRTGEVTDAEKELIEREAAQLSESQLRLLEEQLREKPRALRVRLLLMAYHGRRSGEGAMQSGPYADLVLGLIEHQPTVDLAYEMSQFLNPPSYQKGAALWQAAAKAHPNDPKVLGHAGAYLTRSLYVSDYQAEGRALLDKVRKMDPKNPEWALLLGEGARMDHIRSRSKESAAKALAYFEEAWTLTPEARRAALRPYGQHVWHVMMGLAYAAGEIDKAKVYGSRLLGALNEKDEGWNYGNALHETQIVLGRIALQQGELERAKKYLLAAAVNPGSPQLNSFGPSMSLARELLKKGERETVLQYLEQVRRFWNNPDAIERLEDWTKIIKNGKIPEDEDFLRR